MSETPLTDLREKHQRYYHEFYQRHPEQTLRDQARQWSYQERSRYDADSHGDAWTDWEETVMLNFDIPIAEVARIIGRTYAAVRQARHRYVKNEELVNSLLKEEHEEYDGTKRHVPSFAEGVL